MSSKQEESSDAELEVDTDDDECYDDDDYYAMEDCDIEMNECSKVDLEYFEFQCLTIEDVEKLLNETVEALCNSLDVAPSLAKVLLHRHQWIVEDVIHRYRKDPNQLLVDSRIKPASPIVIDIQTLRSGSFQCPVCILSFPIDEFRHLECGHLFCINCWVTHFEIQLIQGISTGMECMAKDCRILVPEDFALSLLTRSNRREKYQQFVFSDYVKSHPQLKFCPGPNCNVVVRAKELKGKRVICSDCKTTFCFKCGTDYHAPTDCETIKKWLTKCADDSETANYISAHTKDVNYGQMLFANDCVIFFVEAFIFVLQCPKCHICIEKNGGCNHMQCYNCEHDFCWMCLGDWKVHGSEYYECSRYRVNPNITLESEQVQAREALKKYLFYFERWENHSKSLRLEEQTLQKIKNRIHEKVMKNEGTWIDWQYLLDAAALLAKCRYTLQYTYPFAYFMEAGSRKELFEYQQAQLEAEIENLSWKIERAETTDRGDLENQMDIAEKRRSILLRDFRET